MLVQRIIGDCPGCGGFKKFGNVFVRCDHVVRGCLRCKYSEQLPLPTLRKKILYLDQCFFSHAFRAKEKRFSEAAERLREVTALQLMVAPYSSIHEDETNQWRGHEEQLMKFIRAISFGHKFEADYNVERQQLCRAFESFLSSGSSAFQLHEHDAMDGEIHHWDEYMYITIPGYHGDVDRIRTARQESVEALVEAFAHWRATPRTFEQQVSLEMEEQARQYLRAHVEHSARLAVGDMDALINSPLISSYVDWLLECLPDVPYQDALRMLGNFFRSEHYNQIPYLWISTRIYACVKDEVQKGAYTNREEAIEKFRGLYGDIKHVATYAPYCDALFMERKMTAYLSDPRINLEDRYGVRLFSSETMDEFIAWLDQVMDEMTEGHREALTVIFPGVKAEGNQALARALLGQA